MQINQRHGREHRQELRKLLRVKRETVARAAKANRLLAILPPSDYPALIKAGEIVDLQRGTALASPGEPIGSCWFPFAGLVSIIACDRDESEIETGIIGCDGVVNGNVVAGSQHSPMRVIVRIGGSALRVDARVVRAQAAECSNFYHLCTAFNQALSVQVSCSSLAYARYNVTKRLARWMLMCADRVGPDNVELTHDDLSVMIGVRRAGVTIAMANLRRAGIIAARSGRFVIRNRDALLEAAAGGYGVPEAEYQRHVIEAMAKRLVD